METFIITIEETICYKRGRQRDISWAIWRQLAINSHHAEAQHYNNGLPSSCVCA